MLDDRPHMLCVGAAAFVLRVVPPEREAEARSHFQRRSVGTLPRERVSAGLGGEVASDSDGERGELHQPELGQPGEMVLRRKEVGEGEGKRRSEGKRGDDEAEHSALHSSGSGIRGFVKK